MVYMVSILILEQLATFLRKEKRCLLKGFHLTIKGMEISPRAQICCPHIPADVRASPLLIPPLVACLLSSLPFLGLCIHEMESRKWSHTVGPDFPPLLQNYQKIWLWIFMEEAGNSGRVFNSLLFQ